LSYVADRVAQEVVRRYLEPRLEPEDASSSDILRWDFSVHGRVAEATAVLDRLEAEFRARGHHIPDESLPVIRLRARRSTPLAEVADTLFRVERRCGCQTQSMTRNGSRAAWLAADSR
jgi:hypothetical protein